MKPVVNHKIENNNKIQDAVAIPRPIKKRMSLRYIGCLEYRYSPLVIGSSGGVVAQFTRAIALVTIPRKVIGRPM